MKRAPTAQRRAILNHFAKKQPQNRKFLSTTMVKMTRGWSAKALRSACGLHSSF